MFGRKKKHKVILIFDPKTQQLTVRVKPKNLSPSKIIRLLLSGVTLMNNVLVSETETEKEKGKDLGYIS